MDTKQIKYYLLGDMYAVYSMEKGAVSFTVLPLGKLDKYLKNKKNSHFRTEPMTQVYFEGERSARDYSAGLTMRNSDTAWSFHFEKQWQEVKDGSRRIITQLRRDDDVIYEHSVSYFEGNSSLKIEAVLYNRGGKDHNVFLFSGLSLSDLRIFDEETKSRNILLTRLRSAWSLEGKTEQRFAEDFMLEPSWLNVGVKNERYGQLGSMPVRKFYPYASVEDLNEKTAWAVTVDAPASWQLEFYSFDGDLSLSGGDVDYEFGHRQVCLRKGACLKAMPAYVTAVEGTRADADRRLVLGYGPEMSHARSEEEIPLIFNEYCCSWGDPQMSKLLALMDRASEVGAKYFVLDAGWYSAQSKRWDEIGDWTFQEKTFQGGMCGYAQAVRRRGMIPGIWYEFEGVSESSDIYRQHHDWLLTYRGKPIDHGGRFFLDMTKKEVHKYLRESVLCSMRDAEIGYLKLDYNENIGSMCDGAESEGHAVCQQVEATVDFLRELKKEIPELVLEICSSGGHRISPAFLKLADMVSFSDAHESEEGAVIAANLLSVIPARQLQIWATLHAEDDRNSLVNILSKAFLGRMCLSGDLDVVLKKQKDVVLKARFLYEKVKNIIVSGDVQVFRTGNFQAIRDSIGIQVVRFVLNEKTVLVIHTFKVKGTFIVENVFTKACTASDGLVSDAIDCKKSGNDLQLEIRNAEANGCVMFLE